MNDSINFGRSTEFSAFQLKTFSEIPGWQQLKPFFGRQIKLFKIEINQSMKLSTVPLKERCSVPYNQYFFHKILSFFPFTVVNSTTTTHRLTRAPSLSLAFSLTQCQLYPVVAQLKLYLRRGKVGPTLPSAVRVNYKVQPFSFIHESVVIWLSGRSTLNSTGYFYAVKIPLLLNSDMQHS